MGDGMLHRMIGLAHPQRLPVIIDNVNGAGHRQHVHQRWHRHQHGIHRKAQQRHERQ
jgi:hypothetical protein